mmetsp:Transcript_104520/g.239501  ORF Transcript_104520/g.239501 Transcript_104520/m.239501 type:complete len:447 (-) Transcript_104520:458-1798(-)
MVWSVSHGIAGKLLSHLIQIPSLIAACQIPARSQRCRRCLAHRRLLWILNFSSNGLLRICDDVIRSLLHMLRLHGGLLHEHVLDHRSRRRRGRLLASQLHQLLPHLHVLLGDGIQLLLHLPTLRRGRRRPRPGHHLRWREGLGWRHRQRSRRRPWRRDLSWRGRLRRFRCRLRLRRWLRFGWLRRGCGLWRLGLWGGLRWHRCWLHHHGRRGRLRRGGRGGLRRGGLRRCQLFGLLLFDRRNEGVGTNPLEPSDQVLAAEGEPQLCGGNLVVLGSTRGCQELVSGDRRPWPSKPRPPHAELAGLESVIQHSMRGTSRQKWDPPDSDVRLLLTPHLVRGELTLGDQLKDQGGISSARHIQALHTEMYFVYHFHQVRPAGHLGPAHTPAVPMSELHCGGRRASGPVNDVHGRRVQVCGSLIRIHKLHLSANCKHSACGVDDPGGGVRS